MIKLLTSTILSIFVLIEVESLKCYVCDDDGEVPCENFELNQKKYIQECSNFEKACFMKIEGNKKTRSCDTQGINDCKTANGVDYCFCSTDLCNSNNYKFINPTDDEDLLEGSGTKVISVVTEEPEVVVKGSAFNKFAPDKWQYFMLILLLAIMY